MVYVFKSLTVKRLRGQFDPAPCCFAETAFFFFVTFDIIIGYIFTENFIEIPQVVQKICRFSPSILIIFIIFWIFLKFPYRK